MRPQLIVDFSDRTLCALVVTPEGQLLPCSQEVAQIATRVLSSEILFDPRASEDPDFAWDEALASLASAGSQALFRRARRLGLRRPWDLHSSEEALRITSPLAVLSSPSALADPAVKAVLSMVGASLIAALLDPIFSFFDAREFAARESEAFVILPAHAGRSARLALHKAFRRRGFRRLTFLPREIAATMALIEEAPFECLVWDVAGDELHLHRVVLGTSEARCQFRTVAARTVRGLGWPHWVQQIASALGARGQIPGPPGALVPALDQALAALLSGSPDPGGIPGISDLRLSHGLLQMVLDAKWRESLALDLRARLQSELSTLSVPGSAMILLGAACGLEPLHELFLGVARGVEPSVTDTPVLERLTRGVAAALLWLRSDPARRAEILPSGSLWMDTFHGEACEILPLEELPGPGEECSLWRRFSFSGDREASDPFLVHLHCGSDSSPEGNASLCALPLELEVDGKGERELWLALHLRRAERSPRLRGTVEAGITGELRRARAFFAEDIATFEISQEGV